MRAPWPASVTRAPRAATLPRSSGGVAGAGRSVSAGTSAFVGLSRTGRLCESGLLHGPDGEFHRSAAEGVGRGTGVLAHHVAECPADQAGVAGEGGGRPA